MWDITFLELPPIFGEEFANKWMFLWCEHMGVADIINHRSSRSHRVMMLLKVFVRQCLNFNIYFFSKHVPGVDNGIADALDRFQERAPGVSKESE